MLDAAGNVSLNYWIKTLVFKESELLIYAREQEGKFFVNVRSISYDSPGTYAIRMQLKDGVEQIRSGPILPVRHHQQERDWFSVFTDIITYNANGYISVWVTLKIDKQI